MDLVASHLIRSAAGTNCGNNLEIEQNYRMLELLGKTALNKDQTARGEIERLAILIIRPASLLQESGRVKIVDMRKRDKVINLLGQY